MSYKIDFCPRDFSTKEKKSWPRVYAQREGSREVFELHRGILSHADSYADANGCFGRDWVIWIERRQCSTKILGAHRVRRLLSAAA
jgi:hypothetical protein